MRFDFRGDFMKKYLLVFAAAMPLICSAEQSGAEKKAAKTTAAAAKKAAPAAKPLTIPADAIKTGDNTYSKTDAQGKTWIYTKTPFGVTRAEQTSEAQKQAAAIAPPPQGLTAVEDGDKIRFAKQSPFGLQTWTRNKSELTDDERAVWERQKQSAAKREQ
jgi:hypothetical protein